MSGSVAGLIDAGGSDSGIMVGIDTSSAGAKSGAVTISGESDGTSTSGFTNNIALTDEVVNVSGNVWQTAIADVQPDPVNFGIVHVGDTVSGNLSVANTASGALVDVVRGGITGVTGPFTGSGDLGSGVVAGTTDSSSLTVGLDTTTAGVYSGSVDVALVSHNDDLADVSLGTAAIALAGQVNNYANPIFDLLSGNGSLSGSGNSYLLDFGSIAVGSSVDWMANLAVINDVLGPADEVDGLFDLTGVNDFLATDFLSFVDLLAGDSVGGMLLNLNTALLNVGTYSDVIVLNALGHNASGYSGAFAPILLEVRGRVFEPGAGVPTPATLLLILLGAPFLRFAARRREHRR